MQLDHIVKVLKGTLIGVSKKKRTTIIIGEMKLTKKNELINRSPKK